MQYSPQDLFELSCGLVSNLLDHNANSFAADLPSSDRLVLRELESAYLPVVSAIESVGAVAESTAELVAAIKDSAEKQAWRQPNPENDLDAAFVQGSAWFPIADVDGPMIFSEGLVEFMLLRGGVRYPKHSHGPEELYIVLAGEVWWVADDAVDSPRWKKAGDVIHHVPHQAHAITAGEDAVLILSLWRGGSFEMPNIN